MSLDGIGRVNDYIRHPSKWHHIEKMIYKLDRGGDDNFKLAFTSTIQIYNILDIPNMIQWKLSSKFNRINGTQKAPHFSFKTLNNPKCLNIQTLPGDIKKEVTERLRKSYPSLKEYCFENKKSQKESQYLYEKAIEAVEGLIRFMWLKDSSRHFDKFFSYTKKLDTLRSEKFEVACPELFKLCKEYL